MSRGKAHEQPMLPPAVVRTHHVFTVRIGATEVVTGDGTYWGDVRTVESENNHVRINLANGRYLVLAACDTMLVQRRVAVGQRLFDSNTGATVAPPLPKEI